MTARRTLVLATVLVAVGLALLSHLGVGDEGLTRSLSQVVLKPVSGGRASVQVVADDGRTWEVAVISARGTALAYERIADTSPRLLSLTPPVLGLPGAPDEGDALVILPDGSGATAVVAAGGLLRAYPVAELSVRRDLPPTAAQRVSATPLEAGWRVDAALRPNRADRLY